MKSIKTPNQPAYHQSTLWPLEVWVRGLYNSWWFCAHKLSMFIYLSMGISSHVSWILRRFNKHLKFSNLKPVYSDPLSLCQILSPREKCLQKRNQKTIFFFFLFFFSSDIHPQRRSFEHRICAQTQDLQIFKMFNMSQMNPKEAFHNTEYSVQLPYIAGHSL